MRYEILHFPTILHCISSGGKATFSPLVASGDGVSSFAWIGDDDLFGLLYNPEQDLALKVGIDLSAPQATLGRELANAAQKITDVTKLKELKNLKEIMSLNTGEKKIARENTCTERNSGPWNGYRKSSHEVYKR